MDVCADIDAALRAELEKEDFHAAHLADAVRWAVEGGGKRVRPQICLGAALAVGARAEAALAPACAIEFLHAYTLVHDDLPAMDNDTMRRGRASVWARFGEATAILAGDALQAQAFRTALRTPRHASAVLEALAEAAAQVVRGQAVDMSVGAKDAAEELPFILSAKTGALFVAAARMGAAAGGGSPEESASLAAYARHLGLAFQYRDDLLDAADGAFSSLGVLGAEEVARRAASHTHEALAALAGLDGDTRLLAHLANRLLNRDH